jgi:hypothetical protein
VGIYGARGTIDVLPDAPDGARIGQFGPLRQVVLQNVDRFARKQRLKRGIL